MNKKESTNKFTRFLILTLSAITLCACSASAGTKNSSNTPNTNSTAAQTQIATVNCKTTIKTMLDNLVNGNSAAIKNAYGSRPGKLLSPGTGSSSPYYAVKNTILANDEYAMCPFITSFYIAEGIGFIIGLGTLGNTSATNRFLQTLKAMTPAQKQNFENTILSGQSLTNTKQIIKRIVVTSNNGSKATIRATLVSTSPNLSGSTVNTYQANQINGRWYVVAIISSNSGVSANLSSPTTSSTTATSGNSAYTVPTQFYPSNPNVADLYVVTGAIPQPGVLFYWPTYPSLIQLDNDDWIAGATSKGVIPWTPTSTGVQASVTEWGTLCSTSPGNSCLHSEGSGTLVASNPQTCTVNASNYSGSSGQIAQARVYASFKFVNSNGTIHTFPSPCS